MRSILFFLITALWVLSCNESFELNAPYEDIWVVYGVLNPSDTAQYIRISRAFQVEGDAVEYAQENDLTEKGLQVTLTGNGQSYTATQVDSVMRTPPDGEFAPYLTLYRISTPADKELVPSTVYELHIRSETDTSLHLSAQTRIPPAPTLITPRLSGSGINQCLLSVAFEDSARIIFSKQLSLVPNRAHGYQIRIRFAYQENGVAQVYTYGPTAPFSTNRNCNGGVGANNLCYLFDNGVVMNGLRGKLRDNQAIYQYQSFPTCGVPAEISKALTIEVTAIDTILYRYISANDPGSFNINTIRKEYTNIRGSAKTVGILGSVVSDEMPVTLTPCGEYLLRLNGASDPTVCD